MLVERPGVASLKEREVDLLELLKQNQGGMRVAFRHVFVIAFQELDVGERCVIGHDSGGGSPGYL